VAVAPAQLEGGPGAYRWQLPRDALGWHPDTPDCGAGVTVIGGHVSFDGVPGPLARLAAVGPDDAVTCVDAGGTPHRYAPHDYLVGSLADDPADWRAEGWGEGLILYTCTPALDDELLVVRFRSADSAENGHTAEGED
jgi:hypothetical protein